jgi:hypothetical protein
VSLQADMQSTIDTNNARVKAGTLTQIAADQANQCPANVLALITGIPGMLGTPVPPGAGIVWLLNFVNTMSQDRIQTLVRQVNLVKGACSAMLPGLRSYGL